MSDYLLSIDLVAKKGYLKQCLEVLGLTEKDDPYLEENQLDRLLIVNRSYCLNCIMDCQLFVGCSHCQAQGKMKAIWIQDRCLSFTGNDI